MLLIFIVGQLFPSAWSLIGRTEDSALTIELHQEPQEPGESTFLVIEEHGDRAAVVVFRSNGTTLPQLRFCGSIRHKILFDQIKDEFPEGNVALVDSSYMDALLASCDGTKGGRQFQNIRFFNNMLLPFKSLLIKKGTKWCGVQNIAKNKDDLGPAAESDKCCRAHDLCFDYLAPLESKYGLKNTALYYKSHCSCDDDFYQCLLEADTEVSRTIGKLYFNTLKMNCFKKGSKRVSNCHKFFRVLFHFTGLCQKYSLDRTQEPEWNFYGPREFPGKR